MDSLILSTPCRCCPKEYQDLYFEVRSQDVEMGVCAFKNEGRYFRTRTGLYTSEANPDPHRVAAAYETKFIDMKGGSCKLVWDEDEHNSVNDNFEYSDETTEMDIYEGLLDALNKAPVVETRVDIGYYIGAKYTPPSGMAGYTGYVFAGSQSRAISSRPGAMRYQIHTSDGDALHDQYDDWQTLPLTRSGSRYVTSWVTLSTKIKPEDLPTVKFVYINWEKL